MASYTEHLQLLKKDPVADGSDTFNIQTMLNDNWDKIDEAVSKKAELGADGKVPPEQLPEMKFDPSGSAAAVQKNLDAHTGNKNNPHAVTAAQVGADPAGSAAAVQSSLSAHTGNRSNPHGVTAQQVGADPAGTAAAVQQALAAQIAALTAQLGGKAEIHTFSYVGTGLYGIESPNSITADSPIQLLCVYGAVYRGTWELLFDREDSPIMIATNLTTEYTTLTGIGMGRRTVGKKSADGKTFYWYSTAGDTVQCNDSGSPYYGFYIC